MLRIASAECVDTHVTDVTAAAGSLQVTRWFYRQRIEGSLTRTGRPWILLLDPGNHAAWTGDAGSVTPELIEVAVPESLSRTTVKGFVTPPADQQTIRPDANLLFVAGAGWTKKQKDGQPHVPEAETLILDFLKNSKASLGSSKSLVDLSRREPGGAALPDPPESGRTDRRVAAPSRRASLPAVTAKSRTPLAGVSSANGAPSTSTPTADGRAARPTCSMSPMPSRSCRR